MPPLNKTAAPAPKKPKKAKAPERELLYPEVETYLMKTTGVGAIGPMSVGRAKELLGWQSEEDYIASKTEGLSEEARKIADVKFGDDYLFTDMTGVKVRCYNNTHNRPYDERWAQTIAQEHLMRRWRFNAQPIRLGQYGEVVDGQHRLIGLVFAEQLRISEQYAGHWKDYWDGPVSMETLLVVGLEETDEVVNTIDTGRARTQADVLYRCEFLAAFPAPKRRALAKILDWAVRNLWDRTGACNDPFVPKRTHSETLDFIRRHPHIVDAVAHIYEEDHADELGEGKPLSKLIKPGAASSLLYLMGVSASDGASYWDAEVRQEGTGKRALLDFTYWDKAMEFWTVLASSSKIAPRDSEFKSVCAAIADLGDPVTGQSGSGKEKMAVLVKAWNLFIAGKELLEGRLKLDYREDPETHERSWDGVVPSVGGIDKGDPKAKGPTMTAGTDPTPAEIAAGASANKAERMARKRDDKDDDKAARRKATGDRLRGQAPPQEEERSEGDEQEERGETVEDAGDEEPADEAADGEEGTQEPAAPQRKHRIVRKGS